MELDVFEQFHLYPHLAFHQGKHIAWLNIKVVKMCKLQEHYNTLALTVRWQDLL